ncbi:probable serine/threonine-protein kinase PBL19 [Tanacetum coccineum]
MRVKMAKDADIGLKYPHDCQIIFRDFKPSNILLDSQINDKLFDCGVVREGPKDELTHVSIMVVGTKGYAAPEYVQTGRLTSSCLGLSNPKVDSRLYGSYSKKSKQKMFSIKLRPIMREVLDMDYDVIAF